MYARKGVMVGVMKDVFDSEEECHFMASCQSSGVSDWAMFLFHSVRWTDSPACFCFLATFHGCSHGKLLSYGFLCYPRVDMSSTVQEVGIVAVGVVSILLLNQ